MSGGNGAGALPDPLEVQPVDGPLHAEVTLPGSKSITNRALVCAALADGPSVLTGILASDDTAAMVGALAALGVDARVEGDQATVWGTRGRLRGDVSLDARMSGTSSRFLMALAALAPDTVRIDGHAALRARPMEDGIEAVRALGRSVRSTDGALPVAIGPDPEVDELAGTVTVRGDVSSQFLSGLLLMAPCWPDGLEIVVDGFLQSVPYVDMTVAVMRAFGAKVHATPERDRFVVEPTGYQHVAYAVEPDASTASYFLAAAALCGGTVTVPGLGRSSLQGDVRFASVLSSYGADVEVGDHELRVTGGALRGGTYDLADISDTVPTLAAIAPFAEEPTIITGVGFIRRKETDRIAAVVAELQRLGVRAAELDDGVRVDPGPVSPGVVSTYDDHRMAMAFAVLGLRAPGVRIADPGCVSKTFPGFWETLAVLRSGSTPT